MAKDIQLQLNPPSSQKLRQKLIPATLIHVTAAKTQTNWRPEQNNPWSNEKFSGKLLANYNIRGNPFGDWKVRQTILKVFQYLQYVQITLAICKKSRTQRQYNKSFWKTWCAPWRKMLHSFSLQKILHLGNVTKNQTNTTATVMKKTKLDRSVQRSTIFLKGLQENNGNDTEMKLSPEQKCWQIGENLIRVGL